MQVGWLGLGAMGAPMAARAARAGHVVRGHDVVPGRAASLAEDGVRPADTATAAVGVPTLPMKPNTWSLS